MTTPASPIATRPVPGIAPVDGWAMFSFDEWDGDGFKTTGYSARKGEAEFVLPVSRFRFTPSQDRFAWLVRSEFAPAPGIAPWSDGDLDAQVAAGMVAA